MHVCLFCIIMTFLLLYVCTKMKTYLFSIRNFSVRRNRDIRDELSCFKFSELLMTTKSSRGRKRMPNFYQTCSIQTSKELAWFIFWNRPAMTDYIHIWTKKDLFVSLINHSHRFIAIRTGKFSSFFFTCHGLFGLVNKTEFSYYTP